MDRKIWEKIIDVFENVFFFVNFWTGWTRNKIGLGPTRIKHKLLYIGLDSAHRRGLGWWSNPDWLLCHAQ
jgi:hypothetical protein